MATQQPRTTPREIKCRSDPRPVASVADLHRTWTHVSQGCPSPCRCVQAVGLPSTRASAGAPAPPTLRGHDRVHLPSPVCREPSAFMASKDFTLDRKPEGLPGAMERDTALCAPL